MDIIRNFLRKDPNNIYWLISFYIVFAAGLTGFIALFELCNSIGQ